MDPITLAFTLHLAQTIVKDLTEDAAKLACEKNATCSRIFLDEKAVRALSRVGIGCAPVKGHVICSTKATLKRRLKEEMPEPTPPPVVTMSRHGK